MDTVMHHNFEELIDNVYQTHCLAKFNAISSKDIVIWRTVSAKLEIVSPESQMSNNQCNIIRGTVTRELPEDYPIPAEVLLSRLSFFHFLEIMRIKG